MMSGVSLRKEIADIGRLLPLARTVRVHQELDALLYKFRQELNSTFQFDSVPASLSSLDSQLQHDHEQSKSGALPIVHCSNVVEPLRACQPPDNPSRDLGQMRCGSAAATRADIPEKEGNVDREHLSGYSSISTQAVYIKAEQDEATLTCNNPIEKKLPHKKKTSDFFMEFADTDDCDSEYGAQSPANRVEADAGAAKNVMVKQEVADSNDVMIVKEEFASAKQYNYSHPSGLPLPTVCDGVNNKPYSSSEQNLAADINYLNDGGFDEIFGTDDKCTTSAVPCRAAQQTSPYKTSAKQNFTLEGALNFLHSDDNSNDGSSPTKPQPAVLPAQRQVGIRSDRYADSFEEGQNTNDYGFAEDTVNTTPRMNTNRSRMPYVPSSDADTTTASSRNIDNNRGIAKNAPASATTVFGQQQNRRYDTHPREENLADTIIECESPENDFSANFNYGNNNSNIGVRKSGGFMPASRYHATSNSTNSSASTALVNCSEYTRVEPYILGSNVAPPSSRSLAVPLGLSHAFTNYNKAGVHAARRSDYMSHEDVEVLDVHIPNTMKNKNSTAARYSGPALEIIDPPDLKSTTALVATQSPARNKTQKTSAVGHVGGIVPPRSLPTIYTQVGTTYFHGRVQHDGNDPELKRKNHPFSARVERTFRSIFGFKQQPFRTNQLEVINAALLGYDCFVLKPTGAGKSLCYQLPACVQLGVTVVISPLRSLIQDQTSKMRSLQIRVAALTSDCSKSAENDIYADLESEEPNIKLLYITPEKLSASSRLQGVLQDALYARGLLQRIIIDEAHCVSSWGHDFRPDYRKIKIIREWFPKNVPMMALTATANPRVRGDILTQLGMVHNSYSSPSDLSGRGAVKWFLQSFNRPNLKYEVRTKKSPRDCQNDMVDLINTKFSDQCGIVYCLSRQDCDDMAQFLQQNGIRAISYHAGLNDKERAQAQQSWSDDEVKVACATIAFGMGIDKYDVRFVIHHSLPKSVEGYYQESGRAGRDGLPAACILYYSWADVSRLRKLIAKDDGGGGGAGSSGRKNYSSNNNYGSASGSNNTRGIKNVHFTNLKCVIGYCENHADCRRTQLLDYFGEIYNEQNCGTVHSGTMCDNCLDKHNGTNRITIDFTDDAKIIGQFVAKEFGTDLSGRGRRLTLLQLAEAYMGPPKAAAKSSSKSARAQIANNKQAFYQNFSIYGKGAGKNRYDIERLIRIMVAKNVLEETVDFSMPYPVSYIHGATALSELNCGKLKFFLDTVPSKKAAAAEAAKKSTRPSRKCAAGGEFKTREKVVARVKTELRAAMQEIKKEKASTSGNYGSAYDICGPDIIARIAYVMPRNEQRFMEIGGVSHFMYQQIGERFLRITLQYAKICDDLGFEDVSETDFRVEDQQAADAEDEEEEEVPEIDDTSFAVVSNNKINPPPVRRRAVQIVNDNYEDDGCIGGEDAVLDTGAEEYDHYNSGAWAGPDADEAESDKDETLQDSPHFSRTKRGATFRGGKSFQPASVLTNGGGAPAAASSSTSGRGGGYARQKRAAPASGRGGFTNGFKRYRPGGFKAPQRVPAAGSGGNSDSPAFNSASGNGYARSGFSRGARGGAARPNAAGSGGALSLMPTPTGGSRPPMRKKLC